MRWELNHSHPLRVDIGEYGRLIEKVCEEATGMPHIPRHIREHAKQIVKFVQSYYPTRGRRRTAIVVAALGIARGNRDVDELRDLVYRAKKLTGEDIPDGQIQNTLEDLRAFLKLLPLYRESRTRRFELTPEEKMVLRVLRGRALTREQFSNRENVSPT
jgi:hypothetical protein